MRAADERLDELRRRKAQSAAGGGSQRIDAQHNRGKLTARERLELLLDEGSFQEVDALSNIDVLTWYGRKHIPGDGVVCGHGTIDGKPVHCRYRISPFMVAVWVKCRAQDLQNT